MNNEILEIENPNIIKEKKKKSRKEKGRKSVTALTKIEERKSTNLKLPISDLLERASTQENANVDNNNEDMEVNYGHQKRRSNSIIDKIKLFNKMSEGASGSVNKDKNKKASVSLIPTLALPTQNFVKVVDEQTNKVKWVEKEKTEEGQITSRKISTNEYMSAGVIGNAEAEQEKKDTNIKEFENIDREPLEISTNIIKKLEIVTTTQNIQNIKKQESEIKNNISEIKEEDDESKMSNSINVNRKNDTLTKINSGKVNTDEDEESDDKNSSELEEIEEADQNLQIKFSNESPTESININSNIVISPELQNPSNKSSPPIQFKNKYEKETLDEFFSSIPSYTGKLIYPIVIDFENTNPITNPIPNTSTNPIVNPIQNTITNNPPINNYTQQPHPQPRNVIVELIEEKVSPQSKQKTFKLENNTYRYNELNDLSQNNPESIINISNLNVSNNHYSTIFNTGRSNFNDFNDNYNVLFSEQKEKTAAHNTNNTQNITETLEGEIKEVRKLTSEDNKQDATTKGFMNFINKNKFTLIIVLVIILIIVVLILAIRK